jgi:hypothetical protein
MRIAAMALVGLGLGLAGCVPPKPQADVAVQAANQIMKMCAEQVARPGTKAFEACVDDYLGRYNRAVADARHERLEEAQIAAYERMGQPTHTYCQKDGLGQSCTTY